MKDQDQLSTSATAALTRREALRRALAGGLVAALPVCTTEAPAADLIGFVPEDEYPYFGAQPASID
jgi:hypothetical protein